MQNITPFFWFDDNAEEAVNFYVSTFKNSKINAINRYGDAGPGSKGAVMTISFQLDGTDFVALNGGSRNLDGRDLGPEYRLSSSRAVSFVVSCQTQAELDDLWEKLAQGGETLQCGWLTDRYGVTWQIVPAGLGELLGDEDPEKVGRAMKAILEMEKIDINVLRAAAGQT